LSAKKPKKYSSQHHAPCQEPWINNNGTGQPNFLLFVVEAVPPPPVATLKRDRVGSWVVVLDE
jgi:hypothetical protein